MVKKIEIYTKFSILLPIFHRIRIYDDYFRLNFVFPEPTTLGANYLEHTLKGHLKVFFEHGIYQHVKNVSIIR